jgi:predicted deacylase
MRWISEKLDMSASSSSNLVVGECGENGPKALIVAGIHGDEQPWASMAINRMLSMINASDLIGSLSIIPNANPAAMMVGSRVSMFDHLDLNRSFPGDANGSQTERLAASISKIVDSGFDLVIDLHGGGSWCVNAFAFKFKGSEKYAEAFNPPFILEAIDRANTLTGYAKANGAKVVAVEMGGRCSEEEYWANKIAVGIRRALKLVGILKNEEITYEYRSIPVGRSNVLRPTRGGIFMPKLRSKRVGTIILEGMELGCMVDASSFEVVETFMAPHTKTALLLLRPTLAKIEQGAMTYVVAPI